MGKQRSLRGEQMIKKDCEINSYIPLSGLTPDKVTAALQTQSLSSFLQTARRLLKHSEHAQGNTTAITHKHTFNTD